MANTVTAIMIIVSMIGLILVIPDYIPYLRFILVVFLMLLLANLMVKQ